MCTFEMVFRGLGGLTFHSESCFPQGTEDPHHMERTELTDFLARNDPIAMADGDLKSSNNRSRKQGHASTIVVCCRLCNSLLLCREWILDLQPRDSSEGPGKLLHGFGRIMLKKKTLIEGAE